MKTLQYVAITTAFLISNVYAADAEDDCNSVLIQTNVNQAKNEIHSLAYLLSITEAEFQQIKDRGGINLFDIGDLSFQQFRKNILNRTKNIDYRLNDSVSIRDSASFLPGGAIPGFVECIRLKSEIIGVRAYVHNVTPDSFSVEVIYRSAPDDRERYPVEVQTIGETTLLNAPKEELGPNEGDLLFFERPRGRPARASIRIGPHQPAEVFVETYFELETTIEEHLRSTKGSRAYCPDGASVPERPNKPNSTEKCIVPSTGHFVFIPGTENIDVLQRKGYIENKLNKDTGVFVSTISPNKFCIYARCAPLSRFGAVVSGKGYVTERRYVVEEVFDLPDEENIPAWVSNSE